MSSTRTLRDGGLPSTRQRSSTVSTWCNLRGHCPSTRPGNSEVLVSQTSRHHEAFPCRIDLYASRPSTMPHLASAWNVQSPSLQMPTLVGRATDSPVSLLMTSLSLDDSRPTHHNVVPPTEFQVTHLIDSCCPNQAAEPRWEHNVHLALPTTHGTILFKTTAAEQSPTSLLEPDTPRHMTIISFPNSSRKFNGSRPPRGRLRTGRHQHDRTQSSTGLDLTTRLKT